METTTKGPVTLKIADAEVTLPAETLARLWLADIMRKGDAAPGPAKHGVPAIGQYWQGQGGIYAGIMRGRDSEHDYYLILAEDKGSDLTWDTAKAWAAGLQIDGHSDFTLPERYEQSLLYANLHELFDTVYHWSGTQHASDSDFAWCQDFYYGGQSDYRKYGKLRARAVRRLIIQ